MAATGDNGVTTAVTAGPHREGRSVLASTRLIWSSAALAGIGNQALGGDGGSAVSSKSAPFLMASATISDFTLHGNAADGGDGGANTANTGGIGGRFEADSFPVIKITKDDGGRGRAVDRRAERRVRRLWGGSGG